MNFVSKPTVLGFLNGLAIVILLSQLHAFREVREEGEGEEKKGREQEKPKQKLT
jgi:MFS superfamily sulfate permease-like transporter